MKWIVLLLFFAGCTDNTKVPKDIIARPGMEKILWEMVQADRYAAIYIQTRKDTLDRNKKETTELFDKVFSYNKISRQEFMKSYRFYLGRPDLLKGMFDSIGVQAERNKADRIKAMYSDTLKKKLIPKPR